MNPYATLSKFYDFENADRVDDLPFWAAIARESGGPVLELGCGSGRVALHLAREGFDVIGVDSSAEMLAHAESRLALSAKLASRVQFRNGDFKQLDLGKTFPLIVLSFNTFAHLLEAPDVQTTLGVIAHHLDPKGRVVLELPNPVSAFASAQEGLVLERTFRIEERGVTVQQFSSLRLDRVAQRAHITWIYDEINSQGNVQRTTVPMTLRYFFPNEMGLWLERAELRMVHVWGDYDRSPFEEDSPTMIVVGSR